MHSLSQIIKHRKENAKKRTIDHGEGIDYGAEDQEPVSKRQNKRKDKEHSKDMRMQQGSLDLKDQSKVDVHKGKNVYHSFCFLAHILFVLDYDLSKQKQNIAQNPTH